MGRRHRHVRRLGVAALILKYLPKDGRHEYSKAIAGTLLRRGYDAEGRRPCYGGQRIFAEDEHWRGLITFSEYFHGDNGAGLGASHQTGWTGLVAVFPNLFGYLSSQHLLEHGMAGSFGLTKGPR